MAGSIFRKSYQKENDYEENERILDELGESSRSEGVGIGRVG